MDVCNCKFHSIGGRINHDRTDCHVHGYGPPPRTLLALTITCLAIAAGIIVAILTGPGCASAKPTPPSVGPCGVCVQVWGARVCASYETAERADAGGP